MTDLVKYYRAGGPCEDFNDVCRHRLAGCPCTETADRIEELESVVDVVRAIKWRSIDKDNMEFATTCFVVDKVRDAVAALKDQT